MKRILILSSVAIALCATTALGYDSQVSEKGRIQVILPDQGFDVFITPKVAVFTAELPVVMIIDAPDLGKRTPLKARVSDILASGFDMSARGPPDARLQKSF